MWRMVRPEKGPGMFVWFDPEREELQLYDVEPSEMPRVEDFSEGDDLIGFGEAPQLKDEVQRQLGLSF